MRIRSLLSAAVLTALLAGCGAATTPGAAATVDGEVIPREQLEDAVRELTGETTGMDAQQRNQLVGDLQRNVLTFLIQVEVIENYTDELGITVDEAEVQARYEQDLEAFGGEEGLAEVLASQQSGLTVELYREALVPATARLDVLRDQLAEDVDLEEVEVREVRHILVETEDEAQEIVDELAGGGDFAALAQERSIDPGSGAQGGELGQNPRGAFVPEFDDAVWEAEIGEVVGPVESSFGFHVLEVTGEDTVEQATGGGDPLQAANLEVDRRLSEAFAEADVSVGTGLGSWDPVQQRVVEPGRVGQGAEPAQGLLPDELIEEPTADAPVEE
ncbi:peptidylprolyl isomerase [Egicoccus halophilus]|uniref:PpiC domain-containing protein n=1 Tax=Egicoccus halophilus TaxID=1670830 RepID=A0A8J3A5P4_9ACTN|nr:peptidylprolyl isomerase [Egicoccus halophilus]GGI03753.1 hypothetical protein GCM10011354_05610 [Egicoccus halophilus]